jgi:hypothetical protein
MYEASFTTEVLLFLANPTSTCVHKLILQDSHFGVFFMQLLLSSTPEILFLLVARL